jgi:ubiquinone/menaquinone biosynthesis C-methylase UbiE
MFHPEGPTFIELARQCLSSTERGYDLLATKFDYTPYRTPDAVLQAVQRELEQYKPVGSVLDIGCGTGAVMQMMRPICSERVVGIDFSRGMLEFARLKIEAAEGRAKFQYIRGNMFQLPFKAEFDMAVTLSSLGHILKKNRTMFIKQVAGVLKPGGRFVFVTSFKPPLFSRDYWYSHGFNASIYIRNLLVRPPFIMYYLTCLLPEVRVLIEKQGFEVEVKDIFEGEQSDLRLVVATKRS